MHFCFLSNHYFGLMVLYCVSYQVHHQIPDLANSYLVLISSKISMEHHNIYMDTILQSRCGITKCAITLKLMYVPSDI